MTVLPAVPPYFMTLYFKGLLNKTLYITIISVNNPPCFMKDSLLQRNTLALMDAQNNTTACSSIKVLGYFNRQDGQIKCTE